MTDSKGEKRGLLYQINTTLGWTTSNALSEKLHFLPVFQWSGCHTPRARLPSSPAAGAALHPFTLRYLRALRASLESQAAKGKRDRRRADQENKGMIGTKC